MEVTRYIAEFLLEKGHVLLPGLGTFESTYQPAQIDKQTNTLLPPAMIFTFNPSKKEGDTDLIRFMAGRENTAVTLAEKEMEEYVEGCHYVINKGKRLEIPGVGLLFKDADGNIVFEKDPNLVTSGDFFGLEQLPVKTLSKHSSYKVTRIIMIFVILVVLVLGGFYANMIGRFVMQKFGPPPSQPSQLPVFHNDSLQVQKKDTILPAQPLKVKNTTPLPIVKEMEKPIEKQAVESAEGQKYYIVAGCFRSDEGAAIFVNKLKGKGFDAKIFGKNKQGLNMVCYSSYNSRQEATENLHRIMNETDPKAWLIRY
ncbi:MAG: SPOR domain-containing protein [Bacteroidetes bacterium]|nr:SPOR domain-containing protein [Bacteroidota bacterium]